MRFLHLSWLFLLLHLHPHIYSIVVSNPITSCTLMFLLLSRLVVTRKKFLPSFNTQHDKLDVNWLSRKHSTPIQFNSALEISSYNLIGHGRSWRRLNSYFPRIYATFSSFGNKTDDKNRRDCFCMKRCRRNDFQNILRTKKSIFVTVKGRTAGTWRALDSSKLSISFRKCLSLLSNFIEWLLKLTKVWWENYLIS